MIQKVKVDLGERSYNILVGENLLSGNDISGLKNIVKDRKCHIISDDNVAPLYLNSVKILLKPAGAITSESILPAGEQNKTLASIAGFYSDMVKAGLDRKSLIVALGGGVPGDMAGFAAATYMRGIKFIQIPTSLLAMVDSSVGGKTGVDLPEGKNLIGAFLQPEMVIIDTTMLKTLPERELRCGLAEIVKYGVIIDDKLFSRLEKNIDKLNSMDLNFYASIIAECCKVKARIVSQDEKESGIRAVLNYGHTFGHAVETVSDYNVGHGEGVSIGMCMAADMAVSLKLMEPEAAQRQEDLLLALKLPTRISEYDPEKIIAAMSRDKKSENGTPVFIVPRRIGMVSIEKNIRREDIIQAIRGRCD